jgi:hypothetical protein
MDIYGIYDEGMWIWMVMVYGIYVCVLIPPYNLCIPPSLQTVY